MNATDYIIMKLHILSMKGWIWQMENQTSEKMLTNRWFFALYIGFYAGLIWGGIKIVEYYLKFTTIVPGFLVELFFKHDFLLTWRGYLTGWVFFILFSILAAFIYMVTLRRILGPWMGIVYGLLWWCFIYLLIGPLSGMMPWMYKLDMNTILTDSCLFTVWGLFIGYSISVEYTDERAREPIPKT
jgi:uncharacterized membrane protein YagU involved in acid resistance